MTAARVAVTGLGVVCGSGAGVGPFWDLLVSGGSALGPVPGLREAGLDLGPMSVVPGHGAATEAGWLAGPEDRAADFALRAAAEALADAGLDAGALPARRAVTLGTTLGCKAPWLAAVRGAERAGRGAQGAGQRGDEAPTRSGQAGGAGDWTYGGPARAVADRLLGGDALLEVLSTACASGNAALGAGLDLLREGACDLVLCGGVDALSDFVIAGFGALKAHAPAPCRPFDAARAGLNLGEGAGFIVLEPEDRARARGARIRAYLDGYGLSSDANHMTGPDREGRGAARAMEAALREAGAAPGAIDFVSLHGTATRYNDLMESHGLHRALGAAAAAVPVNSIKGAVGHTLGAAGLLEAIMCVRALEEGLVPPTAGHQARDPAIALGVVAGAARRARLEAVLSTSSGFGGMNAAVVLRRGRP